MTYVMSYFVRNILNVLTPEMIKSGAYFEEYLALLSSTYMISYAVGQLLNGIIGDYIKPKYMVALGLSVSAVGLLVFSAVNVHIVGIVCFAVIGFGQSMLRGPLVKVISENTLPAHARICCVFLSFASFAGPLLAGLCAMLLSWHSVFIFSGIVSLVAAVIAFFVFTLFEKRGLIVSSASAVKTKMEKKKEKFNVFSLFRLHNFIPYMIIGMVVEIAATSVNFWMPTYFTQHLSLDEDTANMIFSAISLIRSFCPFICLFIFKLVKERDILVVRIMFLSSAAFFVAMFLVNDPWINITFFALALICSSIAAATLWSIYIPSLAQSGRVSGANGVLDCSGYAAASLVNLAVVPIMDRWGWNGVILFWCGIMLVGLISTALAKRNPPKE